MKDLSKIKFWLFDLDNTLYDGATKVFDQVDKKMSKFISEKLSVSLEEARKIQKSYFQEYNTTLSGMIKNHKIDADEFLEFVHDVDLSFLDKNKFLEEEIKKLVGKKIIFTNGSRAHALNVTKRIGIDRLFDGIFDIRDCEFIPKPSKEPYKKLVENYKIEPQYCIFFEDIDCYRQTSQGHASRRIQTLHTFDRAARSPAVAIHEVVDSTHLVSNRTNQEP